MIFENDLFFLSVYLFPTPFRSKVDRFALRTPHVNLSKPPEALITLGSKMPTLETCLQLHQVWSLPSFLTCRIRDV